VFAYVLLDNHFHLFFRLTDRNLSSGMHDFESGYVTLFNRNHNRSGPLFQGRFHDVIVEDESHSLELTRYLHLNPVRAGMTDNPQQYAWSSYRYYLNPHRAPPWLDWKTVLAEISLQESAARVAYKRFVEAGVKQSPDNPLDAAIDGWILGSVEFADGCRELIDGGTHSQPCVTLDQIMIAVMEAYGVDRNSIERRGRQGNRARDAAILLSRELLAESLDSLAERFGGVSRSAITESARRARERLERDDSFRQAVEEIRRRW
jgi:hypothetical protein